MEPVVLRTDRLILRAPTAADVDAIYAACQDPEIPRWTTVPSPYTREHAEGFVELVGLHHITPHLAGGTAELDFWATAESRGKGFMAEASRSVIDWGFAELSLARIHWQAVAGNIASARTARALGFRYEGELRQALTSSRGRDDGWVAGLLPDDDRSPVDWRILDA